MNNPTQETLEIKQRRDEAIKDVKLYIANDWELKEETPEYFLLKRNTSTLSKHVLVFILAGWWTLGAANLIYYIVSIKKKKILK